jgi:hypothetical protein
MQQAVRIKKKKKGESAKHLLQYFRIIMFTKARRQNK